MKLLDFLIQYQMDTERIRKAHNHPDLFMFFTGSFAAIASLIDVVRACYPDSELTPVNKDCNGE